MFVPFSLEVLVPYFFWMSAYSSDRYLGNRSVWFGFEAGKESIHGSIWIHIGEAIINMGELRYWQITGLIVHIVDIAIETLEQKFHRISGKTH